MNHPLTISIDLPSGFKAIPQTLALGGELKSSICLIRGGTAHLSESIGDLEQEAVYRHFCAALENLLAEPDCKPKQIVIDRHPDYLSSKYGQHLATEMNLPVKEIQHHYAHIASVMADNGLPPDTRPVLGIALDGLGFGEDGTLWGGEILLADYRGFQRLGHFQPVAMIGGAAAIHQPWRNTLAHLLPIWDKVTENFADTDIVRFLLQKPVSTMQRMVDSGMNAPLASSCGRLFDGVAAALGMYREKVTFEAQAAIALEQAASTCFEREPTHYNYKISEENGCLQLGWQPMWLDLLKDIRDGSETGNIAARFHRTIIHALSEIGVRLSKQHGLDTVALSGGVFQNNLISIHLPQALQQAGLSVLQHQRVPANDSGLAFGQAVIATARTLQGRHSND